MKRIVSLILILLLTLPLCPAWAEGSAAAFTLTPITWDGVGLGKAAVPQGYSLSTEVHCSDETTCLGSPIRVGVTLVSEADHAILAFSATETYFERVKTNYPAILKHIDGQLDQQTMIFMQRYLDAAGYCDALVKDLTYPATWYKDEDMSFFQSHVEEHQTQYEQTIQGFAQYGISVNWWEVTAAQRVYTYEADGVAWAICVLAEVRGYEIEAMKNEISRQWDVPAVYMMLCPLASYQQIHDEIFTPFVENTAVSDKFIQLQDDLTFQIRDQTIQAMNMAVARSMAYAAAMDAWRTASVNSYLQASSYSSVNRFTDYILDQNTYSTSDGYEVSISSAYDYVWDGGNGTVYYSSNALDMPYGAVQLYPIR